MHKRLFLFLGLATQFFLLFSNSTFATCGSWDPTGCLLNDGTIPDAQQCPGSPLICCSPIEECSGFTSPTPTRIVSPRPSPTNGPTPTEAPRPTPACGWNVGDICCRDPRTGITSCQNTNLHCVGGYCVEGAPTGPALCQPPGCNSPGDCDEGYTCIQDTASPVGCWGLCSECEGRDCTPLPTIDLDDLRVSVPPYDLCAYAGDDDRACRDCLQVDSSGSPRAGAQTAGIWTAVGCIPSTPLDLASALLAFAISIGGGIALLIMLFGLFMIATAGGNPEKVQAGQQLITSAVTGLLVIIFSAIILQFIGIRIFNLPGL